MRTRWGGLASRLTVGMAVVGLFGFATPLQAQDPVVDSSTAAPVPSRVSVVVDSAAASVGFALHVPVGSAADPPGQEGWASVVAAALAQSIEQHTASLATRTSVAFDPEGITVTAEAAPEAVGPLIGVVRRALFDDPLPLLLVEQTRATLLRKLRFEAGAPVRAFEDQLNGLVFASIPGWDHGPGGSATSVEAIDLEALVRSAPFGPSARMSSTAALVGRVEASEARALLSELVGPRGTVSPPEEGRYAWQTGERTAVDQDITSTWVGIALPVRSDTPPWKIDLLGHHISEVLTPYPRRPGLISPQVRVVRPQDLPVLMVTFAIAPERADTWIARVLATARLESDAPPDERFFRWQRRRFRTVWLSARARPVERAELLTRGWTGDTPPDIEAPFDVNVWRTDLEDAARALGEPRIVVYGPQLRSGGPRQEP